MQDRVSLYPGRVKLEPVAGQANLYDLTRADQPTQEGTPLNKDSLLKDATADLFGLGADALPDDVLVAIKTLIDNVNETASEKVRIETGSYRGTGVCGTGNYGPTITFSETPKAVIVYQENWGFCSFYSTAFLWGDNESAVDYSSGAASLELKYPSDKKVKWCAPRVAPGYAQNQLNGGYTYKYIGII